MGVDDVSSVVSALPDSVVSTLEGLVPYLKAAGIAFVIYVGYLIVSAILNFRRSRRIKKIYDKVGRIERKLDKVLKGKGKK